MEPPKPKPSRTELRCNICFKLTCRDGYCPCDVSGYNCSELAFWGHEWAAVVEMACLRRAAIFWIKAAERAAPTWQPVRPEDLLDHMLIEMRREPSK